MPLEIKRQSVDISINDQVATTEVVQVFRNDTSRRLEGTFVFPLPANASVNKFEMEVNGADDLAVLYVDGQFAGEFEDDFQNAGAPEETQARIGLGLHIETP